MEKLAQYRRIMLIGPPGSGKTTMAKKIHQALGLPLYHLDKVVFLENWQVRPELEYLNIMNSFLMASEWIIDGNLINYIPYRYQYATHCIYFNIPRLFCYWRIIKRRFQQNKNFSDRAPGCKNIMSWYLIRYTWLFHRRVHQKLKLLQAKHPSTVLIEISNQHELNQVLRDILADHIQNI